MAAADVVSDRTTNAIQRFKADYPEGNTLVAAGGVASNLTLRAALEDAVENVSGTRLRTAFARLSAESPVLAAHLEGLVRSYDMNGIREALKEVVSE